MNRILEYKGYTFNIGITSDDGVYDFVVNDMGVGNYYKKYKAVSDKVEEFYRITRTVTIIEEEIVEYVNKRLTSEQQIEFRLMELGFKN